MKRNILYIAGLSAYIYGGKSDRETFLKNIKTNIEKKERVMGRCRCMRGCVKVVRVRGGGLREEGQCWLYSGRVVVAVAVMVGLASTYGPRPSFAVPSHGFTVCVLHNWRSCKVCNGIAHSDR